MPPEQKTDTLQNQTTQEIGESNKTNSTESIDNNNKIFNLQLTGNATSSPKLKPKTPPNQPTQEKGESSKTNTASSLDKEIVASSKTNTASSLDKEIVASFDDSTDKIFNLRSSLASLYPRISQYLPEDENGNKVYLDKILNRVDDGEELASIVEFNQFETNTEIEKTPLSEIAKQIYKDEIVATFNVALSKQRELRILRGDFVGQNFVDQDQEKIANYYKYRLGEFGKAKTKINLLEDEIAILEEKKALVSNNSLGDNVPHDIVVYILQKYDKEISNKSEKIQKHLNTPEGYLFVYGRRLNDMRTCLDNRGRIVETPYVKSKMNTIENSLRSLQPVFINGELGSGKTELARHIAKKMMLKQWEKENPMPNNEEARCLWEIALKRKAQEDPIIISGHRGLEPDVLTGARTIERVEPLPIEQQMDNIEQKWQERTQRDNFPGDKKTFVQAYLDYYKSPVEVHLKLGPFMTAMEEGKPVIIDEMNAIPHSVLIMANDLLTRRIGETVTPPIPGAKPITIREGFCVMATGNYKPEDGLMYVGRQALDAAFLSRYNLVPYDYLPNNKSSEPEGLKAEESRKWRENNELMGMLVTKMLDENLSLTAPKDAFRQLEKLAFIARTLQDVFSGKTVGEAWFGKGASGSKVSPEDLLKENVLSIRHLIPIIDQWKSEGYSKPLDYYLFSRYVSRSGARPAEKTYLYGILQTMGDFFNEASGWPNRDDVNTLAEMDESTLNNRLGNSLKAPEIVTYGSLEVIERLFGRRPERKISSIPKILFQPPSTKDTQVVEQGDQLRLDRMIGSIKDTLKELTNT